MSEVDLASSAQLPPSAAVQPRERARREAAPSRALPYTNGPVADASRSVSRLCLWGSGIGLCAITGIILWQVFARYILNSSPSWSEQLALYLLVWVVLLAAAAGVRERFHIRITALEDAVGGRSRSVMLAASHAVTGGLGLFLAIYGTGLVTALWGYPIPTLGLPRGSAFLPLPMAGILTALFSAEHVAALLRSREVEPLWR